MRPNTVNKDLEARMNTSAETTEEKKVDYPLLAAIGEGGPEETFGQWKKRGNLPDIFEPFYPYGGDMIEWQQVLVMRPGTICLYPWSHLNVGSTNKCIFVALENEEQLTPTCREWILRNGGGYGVENAEKGVPSLDRLKVLYRQSAAKKP
jgi:hypothetical protein